MARILLVFTLLFLASAKKRKSEYTQKDWDRIAREWEREEIEADERERKEHYKIGQGVKFDPSGKINPEELLAQSKRGTPTMVFFNVREEYSSTHRQLTDITKKWGNMLLNGNLPVQNYPVSENRAIFMVHDGSLAYEVKNFLLRQPEVESVTIDQQHWDADGDGKPTFPPSGNEKPKKKKKKEEKTSNSSEEPAASKQPHQNTVNADNVAFSDEELNRQVFKDANKKSPKPASEGLSQQQKPVETNEVKLKLDQATVTENEIKTEL